MKILIIRLSSIGDVVLTTPVVRCIKEQIPGAEVHFVIKKEFATVLESNPNITKLHILDNNLFGVIRQLRREQFDYVADLHKNYRSFIIKALLLVKSGSFPKLNFRKWLLVNLGENRMPAVHVVDRYFEAVASLGIKNDGARAEYYIPAEAREAVAELLPDGGGPFVAVVTGGRYHTKQIPAEKLAEVCSKLDMPAVLLGGKEDVAGAQEIEALSTSDARIINLCGRISLNESAAVMERSSCVVTPDTGLMHIAAALNKKVVSVWGNTVPAFGMYAYFGRPEQARNNNRIIENRDLPCRPCSKLGHERCPKGHFLCMNSLKADAIVEAVEM